MKKGNFIIREEIYLDKFKYKQEKIDFGKIFKEYYKSIESDIAEYLQFIINKNISEEQTIEEQENKIRISLEEYKDRIRFNINYQIPCIQNIDIDTKVSTMSGSQEKNIVKLEESITVIIKIEFFQPNYPISKSPVKENIYRVQFNYITNLKSNNGWH